MAAASATAVASAISGKMPAVNGCGPLELLVVQPTPFCNIDCSYCYLPDRRNTRKITAEILEQIFAWTFRSGLVREPFTLLWHAGEPTVLPASFYEEASVLLERYNNSGFEVTQSFQTNATLINDAWCEFIKRRKVHVGVSVDGPAFLHDRYRKTRRGGGTFEKTLQGMRRLHDHGIDFNTITVLTADSLAYPDELFDFFVENGVTSVGSMWRKSRDRTSIHRLPVAARKSVFAAFIRGFSISSLRPIARWRCENSIPRRTRSRSVSRPATARRSAVPSPSSTWTARATSPRIRPSCLASVGRAMAASLSATWRGIPSRRYWRSRASSRSTMRSAAASNGVTKPAAMRRSAAVAPGQQVLRERRLRHDRNDVVPPAQAGDLRCGVTKLERIAAAQEGLAAAE